MIPLVDLKAQYTSIKSEIDEAIARVLAQTAFIQGEDVALLEQEFASFCGAREGVGVASGTEALRLALLALGVGPGDEVITTPLTFIATASAIVHVGARPVFADVDPVTLNIDPSHIEAAVTSRTKAIIAVHLHGNPADMDPIREVADRHGLKVIEDAAQAHGARYKGRRVGTLSDVACFSFYPGKNLGAYGDAGMVITDDPQVAEQVRLLRDHGRRDKYEHLQVGSNSRLDTIQAAIVRAKLRHLEQWNDRRRAIARLYRSLLEGTGLGLPQEDEWAEPVYHLFVVRTPERDRLQASLKRAGIATGIHYPIPLHLQPAFSSLGYGAGDFPYSEQAANDMLSIPIYPELSDTQVHQVARVIREALAELAPE